LVHGPSIAVTDSGIATVDVVTHASVEMDSVPSGGATSLVSLWQNGLVGLRVVHFVSWLRRRDKAVVVLRGINNLW